ncbi:MAG TPA: serine/threonine protein kinase [Steroidobacteraceae bacterium]|nr:serine/threonine protein kinase [Steroidobacteraceae bacterium]
MIDKARRGSVTNPTPFAGLSPEAVLDAAESVGFEGVGRLLALNSYENRVYQLETAAGLLVLKFYRAGRWSDEQIAEEHELTAELAAAELPVAAPIAVDGRTLLRHREFRFAVFPWMRGRAPELDRPEAREMLGRALARMHQIGALRRFRFRPRLTVERLGREARAAVLASGLLPEMLTERYARASEELLGRVESLIREVGPLEEVRLHGDCHLGNLLWNEQGPVFVDLDDCMMGPRVQDLWMLFSGSPAEQRREWDELLTGYQQFANFDFREVRLIEALRALRMLHHAGWVAQRWADPAFPRAFPWFGETRHWESYVTDLVEQSITIDDQPLLQ